VSSSSVLLTTVLLGASMIKKSLSWRCPLYWLISFLLISSTVWTTTCHQLTPTAQDLPLFLPAGLDCYSQANSKIHGVRCIRSHQEVRALYRKIAPPNPSILDISFLQHDLVVAPFSITNTNFTSSTFNCTSLSSKLRLPNLDHHAA
jgi:hypothetical protein